MLISVTSIYTITIMHDKYRRVVRFKAATYVRQLEQCLTHKKYKNSWFFFAFPNPTDLFWLGALNAAVPTMRAILQTRTLLLNQTTLEGHRAAANKGTSSQQCLAGSGTLRF